MRMPDCYCGDPFEEHAFETPYRVSSYPVCTEGECVWLGQCKGYRPGLEALETWFDWSDPGLQARLERESASYVAERLLPENHGLTMTEQMAAGQEMFLRQTDPFFMIRLGDCELALLGAGLGYTSRSAGHDISRHLQFAGLSRESFYLRGAFVAAVRDAHMLGVHQNWPGVTEHTAQVLGMLGLSLSRAFEVHLPYHLLVTGALFGRLAGRKVALAGGLAGALQKAWRQPGFRSHHQRFGPAGEVNITAAVETARSAPNIDETVERLLAEDFDVALVACGASAKVICHLLWQRGAKTALDVGFVFDALLRENYYELIKRPVLRELHWPEWRGNGE